jgi:hypothetical protein
MSFSNTIAANDKPLLPTLKLFVQAKAAASPYAESAKCSKELMQRASLQVCCSKADGKRM